MDGNWNLKQKKKRGKGNEKEMKRAGGEGGRRSRKMCFDDWVA